MKCFPKQLSVSLDGEENKTGVESLPDCVEIPSDGTDVWEIDKSQLKVENKVASGSYGDFYTYKIGNTKYMTKELKPVYSGVTAMPFQAESFNMHIEVASVEDGVNA
ncbi:SERINE/THREONINE-PROTEIN KINASE TNNI3K-RELATED [Salix viminalis]|uniref:SERINE/THREONINE-PROTEIN KINASE TNNI3K-RELATED n=1 Tax=Salix viminalis TaxID=40686 RepID=A0A9Q0SIF0_SALVM|nr:SERINE/THREONINE-PROTEIN KINASE TNNI3K-RELATED [Salix viminalis]